MKLLGPAFLRRPQACPLRAAKDRSEIVDLGIGIGLGADASSSTAEDAGGTRAAGNTGGARAGDLRLIRYSRTWVQRRIFAEEARADYIYKVSPSGYDVKAIFATDSPFPWKNEISVPGVTSPDNIEGVGGRRDRFPIRDSRFDVGGGHRASRSVW
jgi:hypothetical protein